MYKFWLDPPMDLTFWHGSQNYTTQVLDCEINVSSTMGLEFTINYKIHFGLNSLYRIKFLESLRVAFLSKWENWKNNRENNKWPSNDLLIGWKRIANTKVLGKCGFDSWQVRFSYISIFFLWLTFTFIFCVDSEGRRRPWAGMCPHLLPPSSPPQIQSNDGKIHICAPRITWRWDGAWLREIMPGGAQICLNPT